MLALLAKIVLAKAKMHFQCLQLLQLNQSKTPCTIQGVLDFCSVTLQPCGTRKLLGFGPYSHGSSFYSVTQQCCLPSLYSD